MSQAIYKSKQKEQTKLRAF